jgi:uncharacterized protein
LQIIRQSSFTVTPWKNGGGTTLEAIREPRTGDAFRWRVSVARIDASGPFSDFAGYSRQMVLLKGPGLALKVADAGRRVLRQVGDMVEFDGAAAVYCELLGGPCVDLNLMVANSTRSAARVERLDATSPAHIVRAAPAESTLIFAIEGSMMIESDAGEITKLEPWDLAILSGGGARLRQMNAGHMSTGDSSAPNAVFFATISD